MEKGKLIIDSVTDTYRTIIFEPVNGTVWMDKNELCELFAIYLRQLNGCLDDIFKANTFHIEKVCMYHRIVKNNKICYDITDVNLDIMKEYSISGILALPSQYIPYYAGTFEGTEDPEVEWPHRHSFFSLVWFTEGIGFYVIDFEEYEIKSDRVFFVSPKQIHNWDYSENSKGYILTIDSTLGEELS